jgi:hypothetical protein
MNFVSTNLTYQDYWVASSFLEQFPRRFLFAKERIFFSRYINLSTTCLPNARHSRFNTILNHVLRNRIPFHFPYCGESIKAQDKAVLVQTFLPYAPDIMIKRIQIRAVKKDISVSHKARHFFPQKLLQTPCSMARNLVLILHCQIRFSSKGFRHSSL